MAGRGSRSVSIVVVGDPGSGKTSLISSACLEQFSEQPVPVLPVARFPAELLNSPDDVGELLVADTSSKPEDARATEAALRAAAAVVVCVDAAQPRSLERLRAHWLPEVARLNASAPVVVAVCKDDRDDRVDLSLLREAMEALIAAHATLEVSIRCSAREMRAVGVRASERGGEGERGGERAAGREGDAWRGRRGVRSVPWERQNFEAPRNAAKRAAQSRAGRGPPSPPHSHTTPMCKNYDGDMMTMTWSLSSSTIQQEVFYHAIRAVLYPKAPLLEAFTGRLTTPCVKALLRIFLMCDLDQVCVVCSVLVVCL